jgi:hypothetical protein
MLVQDPFDAIAALDRFVEEELEQWHPFQSKAAAKLPAQERRRPAQGAGSVPPGPLVAERGVVDTGDLQVGGDRDLGDRQKADPGSWTWRARRSEISARN